MALNKPRVSPNTPKTQSNPITKNIVYNLLKLYWWCYFVVYPSKEFYNAAVVFLGKFETIFTMKVSLRYIETYQGREVKLVKVYWYRGMMRWLGKITRRLILVSSKHSNCNIPKCTSGKTGTIYSSKFPLHRSVQHRPPRVLRDPKYCPTTSGLCLIFFSLVKELYKTTRS